MSISKIKVNNVVHDIELNEVQTKEYYYDDGSGKVVPAKHPDLSTQPSILPYKFMGQYVYEQLIPIIRDEVFNGPTPNTVPINTENLNIDWSKIIFLEAQLIGNEACNAASAKYEERYEPGKPTYITITANTGNYLDDILKYDYVRLVYTSMPEENNGQYYDYYDNSNGYEYVDLGLPSGLKWAKCNVGASSPEETGLYFAWGETVGYSSDDVRNGIHDFSWDDYKFNGGNDWSCDGSTMAKYNTSDNLTTLELSDDAASVNMGGSWRMPSSEEYQELIENTSIVYTTIGEVNGWLFTGINGNTLFFPTYGCCIDGYVATDYTKYWSSSLGLDIRGSSYHFFGSLYGDIGVSFLDRHYGCPVRGVLD